jgi:putative transposase
VVRVGGVQDHVHLLCRLTRTLSVATLARELKRESAKWLKDKTVPSGEFQWQNGYGAFSVSPGHVAAVVAYIEGQEAHHKIVSFQDEFRRLLIEVRIGVG